jgi:hypothetical protein
MNVSRGPFNVNCCSNKSPSALVNEISRSLAALGVKFNRASGYLFECSFKGIKWSMEIMKLEDLREILLVKFKITPSSSQVDVMAYKDVCSQVLKGMNLV